MALFDPAVDWITERVIRRLYGAGNSETHDTNSGHTVGPDTPFQLVAVRAAINVLSFDVGALPLKLYRKDGRGRTDEMNHPLARVVHIAPNRRMTSQELREAIMVSLLVRGNFYGWLQRDALGRVQAIYPLRADRITVGLEGGAVTYTYTPAPERSSTTISRSTQRFPTRRFPPTRSCTSRDCQATGSSAVHR